MKVTDYDLALLGAPGSRGVTTYAPVEREGGGERARERQREAERETSWGARVPRRHYVRPPTERGRWTERERETGRGSERVFDSPP